MAPRRCERDAIPDALSLATFAIDRARAFRRIGAAHTAPLLHLSTGDRCLPYEVPTGLALHDLGPALPPETFAAATIVTD
ncbi:MAG: hypothetical protein JNL83_21025 [Myxococcales bacterium]|nr:hypothetical protein [Myxococcales bacterium]